MVVKRPKIGPTSQRESYRFLDGRGLVARRLKAVETELIEALGGPDLSPQKRRLARDTAEMILRREMWWGRMAAGEDVSAEAERRWLWLGNAVRRNLQALGLERQGQHPETLADVIAAGAP